MKRLTPTQADCDDFLRRILQSKQTPIRERLLDVLPSIIVRYNEYRSKTLTLESINFLEWDKENRACLLHCYTVPTKALEDLKGAIRASQSTVGRSHCQYCGIGEPTTEDHYLPKQLFPEYSVLGINLIPCCAHCNTKKGGAFLKNNEREIINFYYDQLPDDRFLFCNLDYENQFGVPKVRFELQQGSIPHKTFHRIEAHFLRLNLLSRFIEQAPTLISTTEDTLRNNRSCDRQQLRELIGEQRKINEDCHGINHWKSATLHALEHCDDFLVKFL